MNPKDALKKVRKEIEEGTGQSIYGVRITAGNVLEDVGRQMGLTEAEIADAVGEQE